MVIAKTAWGDPMRLNPHKFIGAHVYMRGVHELPVCEALARLTEQGEVTVDVGANIGVMTSLLSRLVGRAGFVYAYEAHPAVVEELKRNEKLWMRSNVRIAHAALSEREGVVELREADDAVSNEGTAKVLGTGEDDSRGMPVAATTLDKQMGTGHIGVLKVDVEGHEVQVFKGAAAMLRDGRIRDIIFEGSCNFPHGAHKVLMAHGYRIFRLESSWAGPRLAAPSSDNSADGVLADFVATREPERAMKRFGPRGWKVLRL